ncbi:MAG: ATP-binding protein [Vicinamibacterales bacterium]
MTTSRLSGGATPASRWGHSAIPIVVTALLVCLGLANVAALATWREVEDGVLWRLSPEGVTAFEIAPNTPAAQVGLEPGDLLLAVDDRAVQDVADVGDALAGVGPGESVRYTVLRLGTREVLDVRLAPIPNASGALYFLLAAVGIFSLLVGAAVRLRRPFDQATLHFFWLSAAFFGLFTFSFSGRLDRLDWVFYWGDVTATLLLPPLFLHFTLVFPERTRRWTYRVLGRSVLPLIYVPAAILATARIVAVLRSASDASAFIRVVEMLDRLELSYMALCFIMGLATLSFAAGEVRSITGRRQLRWIAWGTALGVGPFACGYAIPYALGVEPSLPMQLSVIPMSLIPLSYASALVRYRLLDIEIIVKRVFVYAVALAAVLAIYVVLLEGADRVYRTGEGGRDWIIVVLAMLVAVLLAPPVKGAVQTMLDRLFYRDRYDYRRALVGFARDLNSDLDLHRLADRLVGRVVDTLLVDRMALMLADEITTHFGSIRASGFGDHHPPAMHRMSGVGGRLSEGHIVTLDDPVAVSRFAVEEIEFWRDAGLYYFVPCVANDGAMAVLALGRKSSGEPLNSEDIGLLTAVAGQMATALENARLYRQLHVKAQELDRLRTFNENILESLDSGLLVLDLDDRIVRWNTALEEMYGLSRVEVSGRRLGEVFDAAFVETVIAARRQGSGAMARARTVLTGRGTAQGRSMILTLAVVPLRSADDGGRTTTAGTIVLLENVTERVQLEEQLQISEKMASIGLLAAGVAHEVNTPLTGISSFTQMLLEGASPDDPRTRLLEKIERQTFRAAKIVNSLLNLSRPVAGGATDVAPVDLNTVITDVLSLLEHQFELCRIKVRRELHPDPVPVLGTEYKLQQVFLNLFLNAKDAMPKGGWLSISTSEDAGRITAEVSDTGSGIPADHLSRIYDPFFTTKVIGQGTGLGLSISYGIVREHNGTIDCESSLGQGTRFMIGFPAVQAERGLRAAQR